MLLETIKRDLLVTVRNPAEVLNPLVFFVIVISLFPLGISPSVNVLQGIAPGVIWVARPHDCTNLTARPPPHRFRTARPTAPLQDRT